MKRQGGPRRAKQRLRQAPDNQQPVFLNLAEVSRCVKLKKFRFGEGTSPSFAVLGGSGDLVSKVAQTLNGG